MPMTDDKDLLSASTDVQQDLEQDDVLKILKAFQLYEQRASGLQCPSTKKEEAPQHVDLTASNAVYTPPSGVPETVQLRYVPLNENPGPPVISYRAKDPSMPSLDCLPLKESRASFIYGAKDPSMPLLDSLPLNENTRTSVIYGSKDPSMPLLDSLPLNENTRTSVIYGAKDPSMPSPNFLPLNENTRKLVITYSVLEPNMPSPNPSMPSLGPSLLSLDPPSEDEEPPLIIDWSDEIEFPATPPMSSTAMSDEEIDVVGLSPLVKKFYPDPVLIPGNPLPAYQRYPELPDPEPTPEASQQSQMQKIGEAYAHLVSEILQQDEPKAKPRRPPPKRARRRLHRPPTIPGQFYCAPCDKNFLLLRTLRQHVNVHHSGPRPFRCDECGKRFPKESELAEHQKVHEMDEMDKPFWCAEVGCGRRFLLKQSLERHFMMSHTNGGFDCPICPRRFSRNDHLLNHIASHTIGTVKKLAGD